MTSCLALVKRCVLVLVALLAPLAVACAPSGPRPTSPSAQPPTGPAGSPRLAAQQVFRFAATEPTSIDPGLVGDFTTLQFFQLLWEGLVGRDQTGQIQPLAAESYTVSNDGMVYTFKLRRNAKFSDGSPVTARDFVWTIQRNLDPASGSKYAQSLYPIKNARAFNRGEIQERDAVGVTALDDYTLQITTDRPAAYLLSLIAATWTLFPLKRDVVEKHGDKWTEPDRIVSNGPFMMQSWKHDQEMVLVPNPHYWGPKPALERVVLTLVRDPQGQSVVQYESGELDFALVSTTDLERLQKDAALSPQIKQVENAGIRWVTFDTGHPPFSDVRVRRAFYLAIDRPTLANVVFKGVPSPAWTILPPMIDGHNPAAKIEGGRAEARQLLADAGYPEGRGFPEIELVAAQGTEYKLIAEALQPMWKEALGVDTRISLMEPTAFVNLRNTRRDQPYQAYLGGWSNDYNDPYNWHNFLFDSRVDHYNTHWKNAEFDELIARAAGELDAAKRKQLHEQAETILVAEGPMVPLFFRRFVVAVKPSVDGLVFTPELGQLRLQWTRMLAP